MNPIHGTPQLHLEVLHPAMFYRIVEALSQSPKEQRKMSDGKGLGKSWVLK